MNVVALVAMVGLGAALLVSFVRLAAGPSLYDRALAVRLILVHCALLCAAASLSGAGPSTIDGAFALLLAGVVLLTAALKFFQARTFQTPLAQPQAGDGA
jgi:multisubunit Na+/H+ antiporter MnhF subunit